MKGDITYLSELTLDITDVKGLIPPPPFCFDLLNAVKQNETVGVIEGGTKCHS